MASRFRYARDPLCLLAGAAYTMNRWMVPSSWQSVWWRGHFADLWFIPAALPVWLWLEHAFGWRRDEGVPRWEEIAFALVLWTVGAELLAPRLFARAVADPWDALCYLAGAVVAGAVWHRS